MRILNSQLQNNMLFANENPWPHQNSKLISRGEPWLDTRVESQSQLDPNHWIWTKPTTGTIRRLPRLIQTRRYVEYQNCTFSLRDALWWLPIRQYVSQEVANYFDIPVAWLSTVTTQNNQTVHVPKAKLDSQLSRAEQGEIQICGAFGPDKFFPPSNSADLSERSAVFFHHVATSVFTSSSI